MSEVSPQTAQAAEIDPATDRLEGAVAIGAFLGLSKRVTEYRLSLGFIPCAREGSRYVASKAALREYWRRTTGLRAAPQPDAAA
jgi:hypothetical protein